MPTSAKAVGIREIHAIKNRIRFIGFSLFFYITTNYSVEKEKVKTLRPIRQAQGRLAQGGEN